MTLKKQTVLFGGTQLVSLKNNLKIKNKHNFNTVILFTTYTILKTELIVTINPLSPVFIEYAQ